MEEAQVETAEQSAEAVDQPTEGVDYAKYAELSKKDGVDNNEEEQSEEEQSEAAQPEDEQEAGSQSELSIEQLKELAEKGDIEGALEALGFDAKAVKKSNFIALRHKERALREKIEVKQKEANEKLNMANARLAENEQVIAGVSQAYELLRSGDRVGFIEKLTGESWEDYVAAATVHASDPALARVKQLESQLQKRQEEERQKQEEYQKQHSEAQQLAAQQDWMAELKSTLASSSDKRIAALASKDEYTQQVFRIQQASYHSTGKALSHEDAAKQLLRNIEQIAKEFVLPEKQPQQLKVNGRVSKPGTRREMTDEERWTYFANL